MRENGLYVVGLPGGGTIRIEARNRFDAIKEAKREMKLTGLDLRGRGKCFSIISYHPDEKEEK